MQKAIENNMLQEFEAVSGSDQSATVGMLFSVVLLQIRSIGVLSSVDDWKKFIYALVLIFPLLVLFFRVVILLFNKNKSNKIRQFSYFCMLALFFLTTIPGCIFSWDPDRWMAYAFIELFTSFLYVVYMQKDEVLPIIAVVTDRFSVPQITVYALTYGLVLFL